MVVGHPFVHWLRFRFFVFRGLNPQACDDRWHCLCCHSGSRGRFCAGCRQFIDISTSIEVHFGTVPRNRRRNGWRNPVYLAYFGEEPAIWHIVVLLLMAAVYLVAAAVLLRFREFTAAAETDI